MTLDRRSFILLSGTTLAATTASAIPPGPATSGKGMYGQIGRITSTPGQRELLISILLQAAHNLTGCLSYIVARDPADADSIWVTEVWVSEESTGNPWNSPPFSRPSPAPER